MMFTRVLMGFECFDPSPISCIAIQNRSWSLPRLQLNVVSYGAAIAACGGPFWGYNGKTVGTSWDTGIYNQQYQQYDIGIYWF